MIKRVVDFALLVVTAPLWLPLIVLIAILTRVTMGAPTLFVQERPGLRGKSFRIVKFRTMTNAASTSIRPLAEAARLTPFGKVLRSTSLDELPELINVLKGEMSLVGPRPLLMEYLPLYSREQQRRHEVRPGITGWAQVNGRNAISWEQRFKLDVWYVDNRSLWLDLRILLMTIGKVFRREGISQQGHATMPEFTGTSSTQGEEARD